MKNLHNALVNKKQGANAIVMHDAFNWMWCIWIMTQIEITTTSFESFKVLYIYNKTWPNKIKSLRLPYKEQVYGFYLKSFQGFLCGLFTVTRSDLLLWEE